MANIMKDVAKLLGLELEEEFMLKDFRHMYKLTEKGLMYWSDISQIWENSNAIWDLLTGKYKIVKLSKPVLNDAEKEYLGNIIKPFRDRVISIKKIEDPGEENLIIYVEHFKDKSIGETFMLPSFEKKTMYNGMELGKRYTLEELGL